MAILIAYWTARYHALVLVLTFSRWEGEGDSTAMASVLTFTRDGDTWTPRSALGRLGDGPCEHREADGCG